MPLHSEPCSLGDSPMSAEEGEVHLFGCIACIAEPNPVVRVGALVPGARDPQSLGPHKVLEKEAVLTTSISTRAMGATDNVLKSPRTSISHQGYIHR
ncbi:uncharacterized protein LOC122263388 isoform X2 [Penaeus japonicus]|uniref:uncharacterized protein LOC122263388 isoform X2 n=1 Tax=Penaeus japonicus TaxID=27405 RepID=UPI001C711349|nr:uncharacterized protein LOC122263388 isoform X2 [Penaeus japonicus]